MCTKLKFACVDLCVVEEVQTYCKWSVQIRRSGISAVVRFRTFGSWKKRSRSEFRRRVRPQLVAEHVAAICARQRQQFYAQQFVGQHQRRCESASISERYQIDVQLDYQRPHYTPAAAVDCRATCWCSRDGADFQR